METGHTPGRPDGRRVKLALGGHLHGQLKLVYLDQPVTNSSGEFRLGEFLDGRDDARSRGHKLSQEVNSTQVSAHDNHKIVT